MLLILKTFQKTSCFERFGKSTARKYTKASQSSRNKVDCRNEGRQKGG